MEGLEVKKLQVEKFQPMGDLETKKVSISKPPIG